jgi:hypothetical protein
MKGIFTYIFDNPFGNGFHLFPFGYVTFIVLDVVWNKLRKNTPTEG